MSTLKQWLCGHYLMILRTLALLGFIPAIMPGVLKTLELHEENARLKGREEILNLPRVKYESIIKSVDDFRETWKPGDHNAELKNAFQAQWWAAKRIGMCEKYIDEQISSAYSPFEIDSTANNKLREIMKQLQSEADAYTASILAGHAQSEISQAKHDFKQEYRYLDIGWDNRVSYAPLFLSFLLGYLGFAVWVCLIYFLPKLKHHGFQLRYELTLERLPLATLLAPFVLGSYPWGEPKEQVRRFLRFVASTAAAVMCYVVPAGVTFAKNFGQSQRRLAQPVVLICPQQLLGYQNKPVQEVPAPVPAPLETSSTTKYFQLDLSTRTRDQYFGSYVDDIFARFWVQQTGLNFSVPGSTNWLLRGLSVGLWNSSALNTRPLGSGYGSELDFSANWSGKPRGFNLAAGLTYIDVYPLAKLPQGDVVEGTVSIGKTLGIREGLSVEPYLFNAQALPTRGKTPDGGLVTHIGVNAEWKPRKWLAVKANPHLTHNTNGLFGEKAGYLYGSMIDFSVQASKHLTIHPLELQTGLPIMLGTGDKRKDLLVFGFGFNYSFGF